MPATCVKPTPHFCPARTAVLAFVFVLASLGPVRLVVGASALPTSTALSANGQTTLTVCFSDCLTNASASDYKVNGGAVTVIPPAILLPDRQTVLLTVTGLTGSTYTLAINGTNIHPCGGGSLSAVSVVGTVGSALTIQDVGSPVVAGRAFACGSGNLGLIAGGSDYGGTTDQLAFAYETLTGDFDRRVQVTSLDASDPSDLMANGGLTARASLAAGDMALSILASNPELDNSVRIILRADAGSRFDELDRAYPGVANNLPNQWLRMKRVGNSFAFFVGTNGVDWARVAQSWREMPATLLVGCYSAASLEGATVTARFSNYGTGATADHVPPSLLSAASLDGKLVGLKFSETINSATATRTTNYAVLNSNGTPATVTGVKVGIEGDSVYLSVNGLSNDIFTVKVRTGLTDNSGNPITATNLVGKVVRWASDDIGFIQNPLARPTAGDDPYRTGQAVAISSEDNLEVEIIGGGSNLWDAGDYGHYLHRTMTGDFDFLVEVTRYDRSYLTGGAPSAGLMVRNSLYNTGEENTVAGTKVPFYANVTYAEDDSAQLAALVFWRDNPHDPGVNDSYGDGNRQCCYGVAQAEMINGQDGTFGSLRVADASGAPAVNSSPTASRWLRIKRTGNDFVSSASYDGLVWNAYEELYLALNPTVEVGFFTMNDTGYTAPPGNSYDGGNQSASMYSVVHLRHFGEVRALSMRRADAASFMLSWPAGTLQSAPSPKGPWIDATNQSNPQTIPIPSAGSLFYRLH